MKLNCDVLFISFIDGLALCIFSTEGNNIMADLNFRKATQSVTTFPCTLLNSSTAVHTMNYPWSLPVPQSAAMNNGIYMYHQYPQLLKGNEPTPYFSGYQFIPSPYAPMYQYDTPYMTEYQQMTYPTGHMVPSPPAKRTCEELEEDFHNLKDEVEPPSAKRTRIESDDNLPHLTDIDSHLLDISNINESFDSSCNRITFGLDYTIDSSMTSPLTSVLTPPASPLSVEANMTYLPPPKVPNSPVSPLPTMSFSWLMNPQQPRHYSVKQCPEEESFAPVTVQGSSSQVTVMLPDGSQSSLWDSQVPAAFTAYQQPLMYAANPASPAPRHRRRRSGPSHCNICNKSLESSYKLKLHMHTHTGARPFVCQTCGKGFTTGPNLKAHHRVHTGEKPFSCNRCDRRFTHPSDRIIHMVTEACIRAERFFKRTDNGGWECTSCDSEVFMSRDRAERHARQHQTGQGIICPVCHINFQGKKPNFLVKHVKENHQEYMKSLGK